MKKSIEEINQKISEGCARVVTSDEMPNIVKELGLESATKEIDVVTTGTFGMMCSSGAFLNFGHSDPPIKMQRVFLNNVEAFTGIAAVDAYIGAAQQARGPTLEYGGGHVIEDLIGKKEIELRAESYGTDCYPLKSLETEITIDDLNQAIMVNPRNGYQKYNAATNSSDRVLYTYMGPLFPNFENISYSGSGLLSPLSNDPEYRTIGIGTRIFLAGAKGYVIGEGTQHDPENGFGTLMVRGNLKEMNTNFIRAAKIYKYGISLYIGLGIPIPILDEEMAKATAIEDRDVVTNLVDYGIQRRDKPILRRVTYEELKSGFVDLNGKEVKTFPMSSYLKAKEVAETLKREILKGSFKLSLPVESLPKSGKIKPMYQKKVNPMVKDLMARRVVFIEEDTSIEEAAKVLVRNGIDHMPVVSEAGRLTGIITSWDIAKSVAKGSFYKKVKDAMSKNVICIGPDDLVDVAARRLEQYNISAMPVINPNREVVGMISSSDLSKLVRG
ncbi:homocysteine biosynthesis protein [Candidatus Methanoliparum sp. LAM-1]|uniref:homocysteine biosynthesis protein n=1 Tax=Candidatus Methanoliparum sp. LAM-1 TaxID=2874846 RepID=UPI001E50E6B9|nr:homocysteine biosynthesis protein [Candidatus Methanoliparum sp. LAM-1]BDC35938.1 hypothetical protein MTLP_06200 [Candidatus Methanoliparum sp. LAM-1]